MLLKFEGHFTPQVAGVSGWLAWWTNNKHSPSTSKLHQKEHKTLATYHNAVRHTTSNAVDLIQNLLLVSCPSMSVRLWASTVWLSVIGLKCLLSLLWLILRQLMFYIYIYIYIYMTLVA
jgi:hypothetical protein